MYTQQTQQRPPDVEGLGGPYPNGDGSWSYYNPSTQGYLPAMEVLQNLHRRPPPPEYSQANRMQDSYMAPPLNTPAGIMRDSGLHVNTNRTAPPNSMFGVNHNDNPNPVNAEPITTAIIDISADDISIVRSDAVTVLDATLYTAKKALSEMIAYPATQYRVAPVANADDEIIDVLIEKGFTMNKNDHLLPSEEPKLSVVSELIAPENIAAKTERISPVQIKEAGISNIEANTLNEATIALRCLCESETGCMSFFGIDHYVAVMQSDMPALYKWSQMGEKWFEFYTENYYSLKTECPAYVRRMDKLITETVNITLQAMMGLNVNIDGNFMDDKRDLYEYLKGIQETDNFDQALHGLLHFSIIPFTADITLADTEVNVVGYTEAAAMYLADIEPVDDITNGVITYELYPKLFSAVTALNALLSEKQYKGNTAYIVAKDGGVVRYAMSNAKVSSTVRSTIISAK